MANTFNHNDKVVITDGGSVGIGTTSPSRKLEVQGDFYANGTNGALTTELSQSNLYLLNLTRSTTSLITAGNVGINNTSPTAYPGYSILHIGNASSIGLIKLGSGASADGPEIFTNSSKDIYFNSASTGTRIVIKGDTGNVGIGTTSPAKKLVVAASSQTWAGAPQIAFYDTTSGQTGARNWTVGAISTSWGNFTIASSTAAGGDPTLARLTITNAGNVGIGTTSPGYKLDVNGSSGFRGDMYNFSASTYWYNGTTYFQATNSSNIGVLKMTNNSSPIALQPNGGNVGIGTTSPSGALHVYSGTSERFLISGDVHVQGATDFNINGASRRMSFTSGTGTVRTTTANSLYLATNSTTALTIDSSQNVGIGTTSPVSRLHVYGGHLKVEGSSTDQYYLEGTRTGVGTTIRIYDNANTAYIDSYNNMAFRANQNGGSGGSFKFTGGNVGIGTTSPSQLLHIYGGAPTPMIESTTVGANANLRFKTTARTWSIGPNQGLSNSFFEIYDSTLSATRVTIDTSGNVGIGTTSPSSRLHVVGPQQTTSARFPGLVVQQEYYDPGSGGQLISSALTLRTTSSAGDNWVAGAIVGLVGNPGDTGSYPGGLAFHTKPKGTASADVVEAMRIDYAGKVGIGTTSPSGALHVVGSSGNSTKIFYDMYLYNTLVLTDASWTAQGGIGGTNGHLLLFSNGLTERMRITSAGDVGIGTTSPGYKLDVSGGAIAIRGNAAGNSLRFDDSGGTSRNAVYVNTDNYLSVGNGNYTGLKLYHATTTGPDPNGFGGQDIQQAIGTVDDGTVLAAPAAWLEVRVGTTDYVIPMYTTA